MVSGLLQAAANLGHVLRAQRRFFQHSSPSQAQCQLDFLSGQRVCFGHARAAPWQRSLTGIDDLFVECWKFAGSFVHDSQYLALAPGPIKNLFAPFYL
jgi:hypothetical protein